MHAQQVGLLSFGGFESLEIQRRIVPQGVQHRAQPFRPLGVARAGVVVEQGRVRVEGEGHGPRLTRNATVAKPVARRNGEARA